MRNDKLENIGFYTLSDARAASASHESDLKRCELILTSVCNFSCPYCRGLPAGNQGHMAFEKAKGVVDKWADHNLENIRFSGGEPTLWPGLAELVRHASSRGVKRIALSTNGTADLSLYRDLLDAGVNDFSVSLDSCCASTGDMLAGRKPGAWDKVVGTIGELAKRAYVTAGVVLTRENMDQLPDIVRFAHNLGVADIRIIPAAQFSKSLWESAMDPGIAANHPILAYRLENLSESRGVRGLTADDNDRCPLALDDMAVCGDHHYPCIIYMREHGDPIGTTGKSIEGIREERRVWAESHDCMNDPICRDNCLDVCVDYNNRWRMSHGG